MARLVRMDLIQNITAKMITNFENGSFDTRIIKAEDIVEGLRYITKDQELVSLTGRVQSVRYNVPKTITRVDTNNPKDYFDKDIQLTTILVDISEQYKSKVITVDSKEVVEFEGVQNVESVHLYTHPIMDMVLTYTDGTVDTESLEVGDTLTNVKIISGNPKIPDITGDFKIVAWKYNTNKPANTVTIVGVYLVPVEGGKCIVTNFDKLIKLDELPTVEVTDTTSLSSIAAMLNENDEVIANLDVDVNIPKREDGRITTTQIAEGKTLYMDLNGHSISTEAYAFYVNGGTLYISDSTGEGKIEGRYAGAAYPMVYVFNGGKCVMDGGLIDTTKVDESENINWLYGVVCSGDGTFEMTGGKMVIKGAAGISITNGTASGEGAKFTIGGDSIISSLECASVYLADNKSVTVKDNAKLYGGLVARMGDIRLEDKAQIIAIDDPSKIENLGEQACFSGVMCTAAGILALTGVYGSALGNDMNINVGETAKITSTLESPVVIAEVNTRYDQTVNVNIENSNSLVISGYDKYRVYNHDELAAMATEAGKTLGPETNTTNLTIKINGNVVEGTAEENTEEEVING